MRAAMGSIQRLEKGRYRVSIEGKPKDDGRRTRVTKVVRGTREDAEIELAKMKLDSGKRVDRNMTVAFFWKAVYKPSLEHVKPRTKQGYVENWDRYINPMFGDDLIDELSPSYIERRLWEIEGPSAQRHAFALFRQIVNYAYAEQYTDNNPFSRRIRLRPSQKPRPKAFTLSEMDSVMDAFEGENIEPCVLVMLCGGLRPEEACGLYWEDLSFKDGRCYVSIGRTYLIVRGKPFEQKTEKHDEADGVAVISGRAAARLESLVPKLTGKTPLVPNRDGGRMRPDVIARRYSTVRDKKGLRKEVTFKDLRHSFATAMKESGVDNATISGLLRHKNLSTAYDHYLAVTVAQFERAADSLVTRSNTEAPDKESGQREHTR